MSESEVASCLLSKIPLLKPCPIPMHRDPSSSNPRTRHHPWQPEMQATALHQSIHPIHSLGEGFPPSLCISRASTHKFRGIILFSEKAGKTRPCGPTTLHLLGLEARPSPKSHQPELHKSFSVFYSTLLPPALAGPGPGCCGSLSPPLPPSLPSIP